ncbi:hypothetical protein C8A00DRAFT_13409 [Chaetomidium leptoderma]|uniref:Uncharacterized protein n=1 Tax=Chaetomidium leptoderma TaxID=669021 RepID=A0AAN6ZZ66_9PEZI|nr:hypothetical protein C8A00DRAFT_13409 [Chaetomidium leptoderma]
MSYAHLLPTGFSGFGMPPSMGSDFYAQPVQISTDHIDTLSFLGNYPFFYFDDAMSMSLDSAGPSLPQSFTATAAVSPSPTAPAVGNAEQTAFSPDDATTNPAREALALGNPTHPSMLTEFTKRRNWAARVVEELQDLLHVLDANGKIKHVSPSSEPLTGYTPAELRDLFMIDLLHPDDVGVFTSELNESIATGAPMRVFYRLRKKDRSYTVFESVGHAHIAAPRFAPNADNQTPFCQAFFMMARPYPTKNAGLLDSFLEHKIENERLRRKITELQKEEQDEADESERSWQQNQETTPSEGGMRFGTTPSQPILDTSISPRDRRTSLDSGMVVEGVANSRRPSISTTHADTIEMLTGLRYQEGERSRGITTGNPSPSLITGDVGIAIPVDRDQRSGEKKKKLKLADEYVCTDCGTLESPEWRKGPQGPKTLCNACGLRWAKREKKKSASSGGDSAG